MQSSGETIDATKAAGLAVNLLLSGPAGGLTAMRFIGRQKQAERVISFDMGGTSTDVALLDGEIATTTEGSIARFPVAVTMVDMHTIGAGGGSIASIDSGGMLQVGPQSAGADPGPACYGKGGNAATVTDANLVLGRLVPEAKLAGGLQLDRSRAEAVIAELAEQIGMSVAETAWGIVSIANEHMAKAIRLISVNRGYDPKDFLLASFGGAGGLHVCAVAEAMQMQKAMVPAYGGVLSALGMLVADRGRQFSKTVGVLADAVADNWLNAEFRQLSGHGTQQLCEEGLQQDLLQIKQSADLRYQGQSYTLTVPWQNKSAAVAAFAALHDTRYGYALPAPIEIVNLRVKVVAPQQQIELPEFETGADGNKPSKVQVYGETAPAQVIARTSLSGTACIEGPAIITEYAATTYVAAGWIANTDALGNLMLQKRREPE
jgi:N-methylhydantoinase A